jgi:hypothetical protein
MKQEFFKNIPKKDGSGKGLRKNKGRGQCNIPREVGKNMKNLLIGTGAVILGIKGAELLGEL